MLLPFDKMPPDTQKVNKLFRLCLSLSPSGIPQKLELFANEAMEISKKLNYTRGQGLTLYVKGFNQYGKRNYQKAIDTISQSLKILESVKDMTNSGYCLFTISHIYYDMGKYPQVITNAEAALAKWQQSGYSALNGVCYNDMALAYIRMGKYDKTVAYALKALQACKTVSNKQGMAQSLQLMGSSFYDFKNYEYALKNLKAASALNLELKDSFAFARNNNMLGEIYLEQNNLPEALKLFRQSFDIYNLPGAPPWGKPWGLSNIGSVYEKRGDSLQNFGFAKEASENYKTAIDHYDRSLRNFQAIKDPAGSTEQMMLLGRTYFKTNNITSAKKYLTQGLALASQIGEKRHLASSYLYLSKVDSAENNMPLAYKHYQMHVAYHDSVYNQQSLQSLLALKAQEDAEKKDNEIALLETENKLQKAIAEKKSQGRNFAYLLAALFLTGGIYSYFRFRKQSKIKEEQKLLKERLVISQDLHDSIGSTLSSISVYSEVAKIQGAGNKQGDLNELLEKISKASEETVTEMNDIVWALNPRNDSMEKIILRMESFARPLAAVRNIHFSLQYDPHLISLHLPMNKRKNFYLIFKEAVNNAVKYAAASQLNVNIQASKTHLVLSVQDDGIGFSPASETAGNRLSLSGNGLKHMQERAMEFDAVLSIDSLPGKGTCIRFELPLG